MENSDVLGILNKKIRVRMNDLCDAVADGSAVDYAAYKFLCGKIHGLALAEQEIKDLLKNMKENDE